MLHRLLHAVRMTVQVARHVLRVVIAVTVTALAFAFGAVALLPVFGAGAMVVTSGSMEPTINTGGLLVVRHVDPDTIQPGDVITFQGYTTDRLTTHRVLARHLVDGHLHFQTKGDANDTPDVDLAPADGVLGRAQLDMPYAGRLLAALQARTVRLAVLGIPALWLTISQVTALRAALAARRPDTEPRRPHVGATMVGLLVLLTAVALLHFSRAGASGAIFTDSAPITDNTFATGIW